MKTLNKRLKKSHYLRYTRCKKRGIRQSLSSKDKVKKGKNRKGKGPEDEVPFLLKKRLENQGIYEPGIVSEMLKDVTRNTVKAAMSRKRLMDSYKQYREEKKVQADSMKKKFEELYGEILFKKSPGMRQHSKRIICKDTGNIFQFN